MSPQTKSFVSHFLGIIEQRSPWTSTIIRPRTMYMEAANKAGATSNVRVCMRYGPRFHWSFADTTRPMYPIVSTLIRG
jgi:hypothetical protein